MFGSSVTLDTDDLILSAWMKAYDLEVGIKKGDQLALKRMREGDWLAVDVVAPGPGI